MSVGWPCVPGMLFAGGFSVGLPLTVAVLEAGADALHVAAVLADCELLALGLQGHDLDPPAGAPSAAYSALDRGEALGDSG